MVRQCTGGNAKGLAKTNYLVIHIVYSIITKLSLYSSRGNVKGNSPFTQHISEYIQCTVLTDYTGL
jgi:hypothetical protein